MKEQRIDLSALGGVQLPPEPAEWLSALSAADDYAAACELAARRPEFTAVWALLGDLAFADGRVVEAYAFYRVGYHRSLDRLRGNGWRGAGRVPYSHEPNRAFHHATAGLMRTSAAFGDVAEAERCRRLLLDADPSDPLAIGLLTVDELARPPA